MVFPARWTLEGARIVSDLFWTICFFTESIGSFLTWTQGLGRLESCNLNCCLTCYLSCLWLLELEDFSIWTVEKGRSPSAWFLFFLANYICLVSLSPWLREWLMPPWRWDVIPFVQGGSNKIFIEVILSLPKRSFFLCIFILYIAYFLGTYCIYKGWGGEATYILINLC